MIVLETSYFKDSLLGLLGKDEGEVLRISPAPEVVNENDLAKRLIWRETARDEETGKRFPLLLMARVFRRRIWAVGIWAEEYMFFLQKGDRGNPFFAAVSRSLKYTRNQVNWIGKQGDEIQEIGVAA